MCTYACMSMYVYICMYIHVYMVCVYEVMSVKVCVKCIKGNVCVFTNNFTNYFHF